MSISVIIPTYRPDDYIFDCLDSLCRQTLPKEQFEVIVILNGPKDPFFNRLEGYVRDHSALLTVRLLYTDRVGVSNARNMGIDEARGQYVAFIDDDDRITDNYLASLLSMAAEGTIVASNVQLIDHETHRQLSYYLTDTFPRIAAIGSPTVFQARSFLSTVWCKLIPRDMIAQHRFPAGFALGEDALFVFALSDKLSKVVFTPPDTVYYVTYRKDSVSHRHHSYWKRVKVALAVSAKYVSIYLKSPTSYSFLLFASRVVATLRKLLQRNYEVEVRPI